MRDYWLSKLMFDLQQPAAAEEFKANREAVLARYPLKPAVRAAVDADDVTTLAKLVNPYLIRFYFFAVGRDEAWFLERIRKTGPAASNAANKEAAHG
jgi:hypothetical protein